MSEHEVRKLAEFLRQVMTFLKFVQLEITRLQRDYEKKT